MSTARLSDIQFIFPEDSSAQVAFYKTLFALLSEVPHSTLQGNRVIFTPAQPAGARPRTTFDLGPAAVPTILLDLAPAIRIDIGTLSLCSRLPSMADLVPNIQSTQSELLPLTTLRESLTGHITRIDHTGVNLPISGLTKADWSGLLEQIAAVAALYHYPSGEDWPFILPSTDSEFRSGIQDFILGREPKFELVYDASARHPEIQIALGTDLDASELTARFPEPFGLTFSSLETFFRTVYVAAPWHELTIRFDLYYADGGLPNPW